MNPAEDRFASPDDRAIDRLVDGELDESDRRELLLQLDALPDGWRRCALAFLEDQAWRRALAGSVPIAAEPPAVPKAPPPRGRTPLRWAVAASALAATFAAGLAIGGRPRAVEPIEVARPQPRPAAPASPAEPVREVGWIDLVNGPAGEAPARRVPILAGRGVDEQWLRDQPPAVPDYVRAQWEREGYQVEERRRVVSVVLKDGRRVSIPVGEVALEYVGQEAF